MRKLLHGGRVAQQGNKRTEHHQRTGGAHTFGTLGIIRAQNDEGGKSGAGKQFVIGTGERGRLSVGRMNFSPSQAFKLMVEPEGMRWASLVLRPASSTTSSDAMS